MRDGHGICYTLSPKDLPFDIIQQIFWRKCPTYIRDLPGLGTCQLRASAEQLAGRTCCIARRSLLPESNRNLSKTCAIVPLDMTGMVEVSLRGF